MKPSDERDTPERPASNLPVEARNFTTDELEAVIRRAVELQAGQATRADDGVSEVELVRIGQELGLDPVSVRQAMAEVRGRPAEESGALVAITGARRVRAARVLRRPADGVGALVDSYLRDREFMVAQRRFPDRVRYVRDRSLAANFARIARGLSRAQRPLNLDTLDVAVSHLDAGSCLLELSVDLTGMRAGLTAGVLGSSTVVASGWALTAWATALADPFMLLGIPVVAGAWLGTRAIYGTIRRSIQDRLESFLDRVEHDDLA